MSLLGIRQKSKNAHVCLLTLSFPGVSWLRGCVQAAQLRF